MELNTDYIKGENGTEVPPVMDASPTASMDLPAAVKTTTIDANGDLVLLVGSSALLVSSKVLSVASPVFQTMLGPNFVEGERLAQRKPVTLKEDDPDAIMRLCQILHFQHEHIGPSEFGDVNLLLKLAEGADKYACLDSISQTTSAWLDGLTKTLSTESNLDDLFPLLEAAYRLDEPHAYQAVTKQIILHDQGAVFDRIANWTSRDVIPLKLYCELHSRRERVLRDIDAGLQKVITGLISKQGYEPTKTVQSREFGAINHTYHRFNVHDCITVSGFLRELRRIELWGVNQNSRNIAHILDKFHDFEHCDMSQRLGFATFAKQNGCPACALDTQSEMANLYHAVLKSTSGLCLDCFYKTQYSESQRECRVKH